MHEANRMKILAFIKNNYSIPLFLLEQLNPTLEQSFKMPGYVMRTIKRSQDIKKHLHKHRMQSHFNKTLNLNALLHNYSSAFTNHHFIPIKKESVAFQINKYTYHQLQKDLTEFQDSYPFIEKNIIGKSVLNKNIYELKIGNGDNQVHINASFHGNEWITTIVLMKFIKRYLLALCDENNENHKLFKNIYQNTQLSVVPMVNPDGVDLVLSGSDAADIYKDDVIKQNFNKDPYDFSEWKANIKGVDLNKQFPAKWGYEAKRKPKRPNYRDFPGIQPLTEPEARAMVQLVKKNRFHRLLALHTQGNEIYWHYDDEIIIKNAEKNAQIFADVSGYKTVKNIDNYAGYKDWFISYFKKEGYTLELGEGKNPLPLQQLSTIQQECNAILEKALTLDFILE